MFSPGHGHTLAKQVPIPEHKGKHYQQEHSSENECATPCTGRLASMSSGQRESSSLSLDSCCLRQLNLNGRCQGRAATEQRLGDVLTASIERKKTTHAATLAALSSHCLPCLVDVCSRAWQTFVAHVCIGFQTTASTRPSQSQLPLHRAFVDTQIESAATASFLLTGFCGQRHSNDS